MAQRPESPFSFLHGVYIAVDAIGGSRLVVDGPYCVADKAEMQYGHNLNSTLLMPHDFSHLEYTLRDKRIEEVRSMAAGRAPAVERVLEAVQRRPGVEVVLTTAFDFVHLTGIPLDALAERRTSEGLPPVLEIPSRSLDGDWLDGYSGVLETLAARVPLASGRTRAGAIGIVGYLFDRAEPDHFGNLRELDRLLARLGLRLCSTWLGGQRFSELPRIEEAEVIVSFPYGRTAARELGRRLDVEVIEQDLPLSLSAIERFVRRIGERFGKNDQSEQLTAEEGAAAVRDSERAVCRYVAGHRAEIALDPWLGQATRDLCRELGLEVSSLTTPSRIGKQTSPEQPPAGPEADNDEGEPFFRVAPPVHQHIGEPAMPVFFGYPNYLEHPLSERPFLGYRGFRNMVEKFTSAALMGEYRRLLHVVGGQDDS